MDPGTKHLYLGLKLAELGSSRFIVFAETENLHYLEFLEVYNFVN